MKKLMLSVVMTLGFGLMQTTAYTQTVQVEKTHPLSGKARRGTLAHVEFTNGNYILTYVTSETKKKMKFQVYTFDKDFNFISQADDELEFEQAKTKYKWFKFQKEEYVVEGLSVEPNMMGTLVLKKKRVTHSFDPVFWGYRKKTEILEKVKPKTEEGNKLFYYRHIEDDNTGDAYVLVGEKPKNMKDKDDADRQMRKYHIMRFNKDCDLVSDLPFEFTYPVSLVDIHIVPVPEPTEVGVASIGDINLMFAPGKIKGMTNNEAADKYQFTYMRVDNTNKLVARFDFKSPATGWRVDEMIAGDEKGTDIYYYGVAAEGDEDYWNMAYMAKKYKAVQLMKIHENKMEYITSTNLEEFKSKLKTPPGQKKTPEYQGKKFDIASYSSAPNGDFFVMGQNIEQSDKGKRFKDVLSFHFDNKGVLRSQYGLDIIETNDLAQARLTPQQLLPGASAGNMYWFVREIDGVNAADRLLTYGRIGKIDMNGATVGDFKILGSANNKKPDYFLDPNFPYLTSETPGTVVFFGSDKKEKNLWFSRVFLD
ncbi:MAG TPA: hypothetical protein VD905_13530 [Flavobacteriales bacterium]|nr:hypothetical protein [Flavobacteriales bacterium]